MSGDPIELIKERLDIVDTISQVVNLKKAGRNYKGLCPFHSEKTPSFIVFPDKGNYHCFGCGANGDIFTFVMSTQHLECADALKLLAAKAGVTLPERAMGEQQDDGKSRLFEVNALTAQYFHNLLLKSSPTAGARAFLRERGIDADTVERFQLGYSPDSWDALSTYLLKAGCVKDDIEAAGLVVKKDSGGSYDRFRGRLVFPIRDQRGRVLGFGARSLDGSDPKYLNSPETPIFNKGAVLYGIDLAAPAIRQADRVIVVEGYVDVLMGHQSGIQYMVASLGTSLTERQLSLLKKLTRNVVLALDPDEAGDEATSRGLEVARQVFSGKGVLVPTERGLILEPKVDADIRIMTLPRGKDPDELIREDVQDWHRRLAEAKPVVDHYFDVTLAGLDLASAQGKSAAVARLGPIIREIGDLVQRWHYIQELAARIGVSEQVVATAIGRSDRRSTGRDRHRRDVAQPERVGARRGLSLEEYCIFLLLQHPELTRHPARIEPADIRDSRGREILRRLYDLLSSGELPDLETLRNALDGALVEVLDEMIARSQSVPALTGEELDREATRLFDELRRFNIRERIREVADLKLDAERAGDREAVKELVAITEDLLAQLEPYERGSARAWVWKRSSGAIDS